MQTAEEILESLKPPAPVPMAPRPLPERLREATRNNGAPFYSISSKLLVEAADFIEASLRREFAEHVIATDAARDKEANWQQYLSLRKQVRHAPEADKHALVAQALELAERCGFEPPQNAAHDAKGATTDDLPLRLRHAAQMGDDAHFGIPAEKVEVVQLLCEAADMTERQQRFIAALSTRLGEADAKLMVAARDARQHPLRTIFTKADPLSVKWDTSTGFESAAEMSAVQIEARAAGLKEGMTFRAAVQQCMQTSDNALRPVGWPRGYCFVLSGAAGNLTMPGMQGGPVTISADEILGPWVVLPIAQVQREAAERAADGVEIR